MIHLQKLAINLPLLLFTIVNVALTTSVMWIVANIIAAIYDATLIIHSAIIIMWLLLFATAACWLSAVNALFTHWRKPIREELIIINDALELLQRQTDKPLHFRILIENQEYINASARGIKTWTLTTGALHKLSREEIAAVLAHEMGHHHSYDTRMGSALHLNNLINYGLTLPGKLFLMYIIKRLTIFRGLILLIILVITCILQWFTPTLIIIALLIPIIILPLSARLLHPIYLKIKRITEYAQDKHACELGFGDNLRSALLKIASESPQTKISWWHITFNNTHPILHDRVRRLDKLLENKRVAL